MDQKTHLRTSLERTIPRLDRRIAALLALDARYTWARLIVFFMGGFASLVVYTLNPRVGLILALVTLGGFGVLVARHRRVLNTLADFRRWRAIQAEHIARITLNWARLPTPLAPSPERDHPFERDLDLTGERSLHRLLDTTVSVEGSVRLRDRLLTTPPDLATVTARQSLVRQLRPLGYFRDRLALAARRAAGARRWEAGQLLAWFEPPTAALSSTLAPSHGNQKRWLLVIWTLAATNALLFLLNRLGVIGPLWAISFLIYVAVSLTQMRGAVELLDVVVALREALAPLAAVARRLERYPMPEGSPLARVCAPFRAADRPSAQLRRAAWLTAAAGLRSHPLMWATLNTLVPWDLTLAYQLNRWRHELAARVPVWLDAWFEVETACALAAFGGLNPAAVFPDVRADAVFQARQLGHPLIPDANRVCNDFAFEHMGEVALITGSNMSGKSSFLRTLGVNLCLAYAGAPVLADTLATGLFRLFTCIQVSDSLADGFSYFYTEVRLLRALLSALEMADPLPLLFLIDEIFRGTNNRERLIGSRAYLRALTDHHGVGAIATHDLELTALPGLTNYHFEDQVAGGQMSFDYRLRPGPSPTTNALKIMRLAGLPVEVSVP